MSGSSRRGCTRDPELFLLLFGHSSSGSSTLRRGYFTLIGDTTPLIAWDRSEVARLYIPLDDTPLHSIPSVCPPWGDRLFNVFVY